MLAAVAVRFQTKSNLTADSQCCHASPLDSTPQLPAAVDDRRHSANLLMQRNDLNAMICGNSFGVEPNFLGWLRQE